MQQITLKIADDYIQKFTALLKALPENKVEGYYTYVDDLGDTIEVVGNKEYVIPNKEDIIALKEAKEYVTMDDIKNEREKNV
ncbi:MAG: hypothetical protein IMF12_03835 [Proteobacteria bacterium]|nr:hypothetical protein [Pseudomonadota bacterium]